ILRVLERQIREYSPFDVYVRALQEYCKHRELSDREWLETESKVYAKLDEYQREGFHALLDISDKYRGAFLCDGVGLGKTFIGLMLIEYLVKKLRKRVVLLVPKAARKPVWESKLRHFLPEFQGAFTNLMILNHSDLL